MNNSLAQYGVYRLRYITLDFVKHQFKIRYRRVVPSLLFLYPPSTHSIRASTLPRTALASSPSTHYSQQSTIRVERERE